MVYQKTFLILVTLFIITGCVPTKEIESLGIINARGVDLSQEEGGDEYLETTFIVLQFDPQHQTLTQTIIDQGKTMKGAREKAGYQISYELVPGQISVELFGRELAERGLSSYLSGLVRDARDNDTALFAITNSTAREVLTSGQDKLGINVAQYLQNIIEKEMDEGRIPKTSITRFGHMHNDIGLDPVLPIIDIVEDKPTLNGLAVFKNDKYVDSVSMEEALLINLFKKKIKNAPMEVTIPIKPFVPYVQFRNPQEEEHLSMRLTILKGKAKTTLKDKDKLQFQTDVSLEMDLNETSLFLKIDEKVIHLFEKEIEKELKGNYEKLLKRLQETNADVFGYGRYYKAKLRNEKLTTKKWREKFPEITVDFNVNVKIDNYGTIQ